MILAKDFHHNPDSDRINEIFAAIADRYDLTNHVLSMGLDFYWRSVLGRMVQSRNPLTLLDLATGSGDVAIALARRLGHPVHITGMDFCPPMLQIAQKKFERRRKPGWAQLEFRLGDCLEIPCPDNSYEAISIAFGYRNLKDRKQGLSEMKRVLKSPGGTLFILDFSQPVKWFQPLYFTYLNFLLPKIATLITGRSDSYLYLADSISNFPDKESLRQEILQAGFSHVSACGLSLSTVAIHTAVL